MSINLAELTPSLRALVSEPDAIPLQHVSQPPRGVLPRLKNKWHEIIYHRNKAISHPAPLPEHLPRIRQVYDQYRSLMDRLGGFELGRSVPANWSGEGEKVHTHASLSHGLDGDYVNLCFWGKTAKPIANVRIHSEHLPEIIGSSTPNSGELVNLVYEPRKKLEQLGAFADDFAAHVVNR